MINKRIKLSTRSCRQYIGTALIVGGALASVSASGQTSFASGTEIVIPTAANISVYHTRVFVRNPSPTAIALNVRYYQSIDGTAPSGLRACAPLSLQGNESSAFDLGAQCGLTGTDDDFGMIILEDASPEKTNQFFAYARTQTPDGIGFSVEGFPTSNFSGAPADVLGLQNLPAAPTYRSNCFVASLGQAVNWQLQLVQGGTEAVLGSTSGSLGPYETTRILDVFGSLGLSGDFTNVRASFATGDDPEPAFIGFCTLETSSNGSADFRIAKTLTPPPPTSNPTLSATWNGAVQTLLAGTPGPEYLGSPATVTLAAPGNVSAYGGGWFAKQSSGIGSMSLAVCYQDQSGPGPLTVFGTPTTVSVNGTQAWHFATGSVDLVAGSYNVGLCAQNLGVNSINKNGNTSGFVFVAQ